MNKRGPKLSLADRIHRFWWEHTWEIMTPVIAIIAGLLIAALATGIQNK